MEPIFGIRNWRRFSVMTTLPCPIPDCDFVTQDVDIVGATAILNLDSHIHFTAPTNVHHIMRCSKHERSKFQFNYTNEDWSAFQRRRETFWIKSGIQDIITSSKLLEYISKQLGILYSVQTLNLHRNPWLMY